MVTLVSCSVICRLVAVVMGRTVACGKDSEIKAKDTIACHSCGHRILYKKRTKRGNVGTEFETAYSKITSENIRDTTLLPISLVSSFVLTTL
jgi:DNA-directed RNA polymerase subunit RPC12/RpoP